MTKWQQAIFHVPNFYGSKIVFSGCEGKCPQTVHFSWPLLIQNKKMANPLLQGLSFQTAVNSVSEIYKRLTQYECNTDERIYFRMDDPQPLTTKDFVCGLVVYHPEGAQIEYVYDETKKNKEKCPRILLTVTWRYESYIYSLKTCSSLFFLLICGHFFSLLMAFLLFTF